MRSFGKWLKATRVRRGMTQRQLANAIGVDKSYISHLEHSDFLTRQGTQSHPTTALIDAMARALDVSCDEARFAASLAPSDHASSVPFGEWLRRTRLKSGMSQEILAHNIGVTGAYISLLEGEKCLTKQGSPIRPSLHLVDAMASTLGVSCEEARLVAGFAPPEMVPRALQKLSLLDMFLRLPVHVQEDVKAQVEALYFKYSSQKITDSAQTPKGSEKLLDAADEANEISSARFNDETTLQSETLCDSNHRPQKKLQRKRESRTSR